jgi:hypothetical protein
MTKILSPICFALMTPNWVIVKLHLPRLSRDGMSPSLCGGPGKRKSTSVKFAILALTAKLAQTVPIAPRTAGLPAVAEHSPQPQGHNFITSKGP